ncbi:hypothetical protein B4U80_12417, partial [Leptotrombidium deliense]
DKTGVRSLLGALSFYNKFYYNFSVDMKAFYDLLKTENDFKWSKNEIETFNKVKRWLTSKPILSHFHADRTHIVAADASKHGIGAILYEVDENNLRHVLEYASRLFTTGEQNLPAHLQEAKGLVFAVKKFHYRIANSYFLLETDHCGLCYIMTKKELPPPMARLAMFLQGYDFDIVYKSGRKHLDVDYLSRNPLETIKEENEEDVMFMYSISDSLQYNIKKEQQKDNYCNDVKNKIQRGADVRNFEIKDGILYRLVRTSTGVNYALVIPEIKRNEILRLCHDDPLAG